MSLIIKGINMPKNGEMTIAFASDENGENTLARILDTSGKPIEHKGVAEIPTPRGDLVDRDDLIDEINRVTFVKRYDYNVAYNIVTDAETIIEAEASAK